MQSVMILDHALAIFGNIPCNVIQYPSGLFGDTPAQTMRRCLFNIFQLSYFNMSFCPSSPNSHSLPYLFYICPHSTTSWPSPAEWPQLLVAQRHLTVSLASARKAGGSPVGDITAPVPVYRLSSIQHQTRRSMGLPCRTAAPNRPLFNHPWPFLDSPMPVPIVVSGKTKSALAT